MRKFFDEIKNKSSPNAKRRGVEEGKKLRFMYALRLKRAKQTGNW